MLTVFNVFEATEFSTSPYDQWFNNFLNSSVNKESISQYSFRISTPFCLNIFFSARPFSGNALKKQPVSSIFQILAGSLHIVNSKILFIQVLTVYSGTSPASQFTFLSCTPCESFHFPNHRLEAVKFRSFSRFKHFLISMVSYFNIGPFR